jgi:hypothetical protein
MVRTSLAACSCSNPIFMEEIKHLKIETTTHLFPKFMRMQENVFDSCMYFFFYAHRRGAPDNLFESARRIEPGCRGGCWASFNYWKPRTPIIPVHM